MNTSDVTPLVARPTLEGYDQKANELLASCLRMDEAAIQHVFKYHPDPAFKEVSCQAANFTMEDARLTLAQEHGFLDYEAFIKHIIALSDEHSATFRFERAAEAIVCGDDLTLSGLLRDDPGLIMHRSDRAHKASLLHYIAANGVENFRQKSSGNAVKIADILLQTGCEVDAPANLYNNYWVTTMELLVSSVHPCRAGVQSRLIEKLLDYGAAVDGLRNDCSPLLTAICFHFPEAAETLVQRGAKVDTIVGAAALGHLQKVKNFIDGQGRLRPEVPFMQVPWADCKREPAQQLELALVWAAMHNRAEVVSFLLDQGVSPNARDCRKWTALHWAAYYGYPETLQVLLNRKAPLEARNELGGTVLDQALWATVHEGVGPNHYDTIKKLIEAGAKIHPWWLFTSLTPPLDSNLAELLSDYVAISPS
jgi:hypothetical protein